jgi:hypothetical protein
MLTQCGHDNFRVFAWHLDQHSKARMALEPGSQCNCSSILLVAAAMMIRQSTKLCRCS